MGLGGREIQLLKCICDCDSRVAWFIIYLIMWLIICASSAIYNIFLINFFFIHIFLIA